MKKILKVCITVYCITQSYSLKTEGRSAPFDESPFDESPLNKLQTILPNVQNIAKECFLKPSCFSGFTINPIGVASLHNTQVIFLNHDDLDDGGHIIRYEIAKLLNEPSLILITNDDIYCNDCEYTRHMWEFYVNTYKKYYSTDIDFINYRFDILIHFYEKQPYNLYKGQMELSIGLFLLTTFVMYL